MTDYTKPSRRRDAQLSEVLASALSEAGVENAHIAIRLDDVAQSDPCAAAIIRMLAANGQAVSLQVIPALLDAATTNDIRALACDRADLIEVNQHGWRHRNFEPSTKKKQEFGAARGAEDKRADIAAGRDLLASSFGAIWRPLFTPPWNRMDGESASACAEFGFLGLSCFGEAPVAAGLRDFSANLSFDTMAENGPVAAAVGIVQAAEKLVTEGRAVIMVHPTRQTVDRLADLLTIVRCAHAAGVKSCLLSALPEKAR